VFFLNLKLKLEKRKENKQKHFFSPSTSLVPIIGAAYQPETKPANIIKKGVKK